MMSEKDVEALDVLGVVNAADAMDDMIEWDALAKESNLNPEELVPVLIAMGSPEAEARRLPRLKLVETLDTEDGSLA